MKTEDSTIYIQVVFHRRLKRIFTFFLRLITSSLPTVHSVYTPLLLFLVSERGPQGLERVGRVLRYSGAAAADRWPKQRENYSRRIINVSVRVIFQCCRSGPRGGSSWKLSFGVLVKTLLFPGSRRVRSLSCVFTICTIFGRMPGFEPEWLRLQSGVLPLS